MFALPSGQLMGLTQHDGVDTAARVEASVAGMDHVGFGVEDRAGIEEWRDHLDEADYGLALSSKDPDGNALESFVLDL